MSGRLFAFESGCRYNASDSQQRAGEKRFFCPKQCPPPSRGPHHTSMCLLCARHSAEAKDTDYSSPQRKATEVDEGDRPTQMIFLVVLSSVLPAQPVFGYAHWGLSVISPFPIHFLGLIWATAALGASVV